MNKNITQVAQNDKQSPKSIKSFFIRFHFSSALGGLQGVVIPLNSAKKTK